MTGTELGFLQHRERDRGGAGVDQVRLLARRRFRQAFHVIARAATVEALVVDVGALDPAARRRSSSKNGCPAGLVVLLLARKERDHGHPARLSPREARRDQRAAKACQEHSSRRHAWANYIPPRRTGLAARSRMPENARFPPPAHAPSAAEVDRPDAGAARRAASYVRRAQPGHRRFSSPSAMRRPLFLEGEAGRRQDRDRQGARRRPRPPS